MLARIVQYFKQLIGAALISRIREWMTPKPPTPTVPPHETKPSTDPTDPAGGL